MKPYSPRASLLNSHGAPQRLPFGEARNRPDRGPWEDLLFVVRPLRGGKFAYDGMDSACAALLRLPSGNVSGLGIFQCWSSEDSESICEVLRTCVEDKVEVRIHHSLTLGGLRREVETIVFPVTEPEKGVIALLVGRHRILPEEFDQDESDEPAGLADDLASMREDIQQRIASELHDSTCQHLVAASLGLVRIRTCVGPANGVDRLCELVDASIDRALREIRSLTYLMHPQDVVAEGLKATIECYACGFAARTALRVQTDVDAGVDRLSYEIQRSLLRVIQEGLSNIFRHAKATEVKLLAKVTGEQFQLTISDNGSGFPAHRANRFGTTMMGVGIPAMRSRLAHLGGSLEIRSNPESSGTMLYAVFPLPSEAKRRRRRLPLQ
ncbi:diguanylate cyclase [Bradyrhizobium sp. 44]|uniref:sensor histidine kinase n=1 Tax=Bradyrhizobium sp. 44 TaxID=2782675 RepID=UPI001FF70CED|nr:ATP-binding protein [Bradyrhizobium sp. 44]MCK1286725.1 diguanylate cyclase [Bradyrhizobium sp. 44]